MTTTLSDMVSASSWSCVTKTKVVFAHAASNVLAVDQRQTNEEPFSGRLRMVFLQMPEFTKTESECTTDLDKWAFIMNHLETLTHIPCAAQDELYAELSRVSNVSALSPAERATYEENLRQYRDNLAAFTAAYQDGEKSADTVRHVCDHPFFGSAAPSTRTVAEEMDELRGGRFDDL